MRSSEEVTGGSYMEESREYDLSDRSTIAIEASSKMELVRQNLELKEMQIVRSLKCTQKKFGVKYKYGESSPS